MFTDIEKGGWIEQMPSAVRPYLYLSRLDRPVGVWLLLLPGVWSIGLSSGLSGVAAICLFVVGATVMRAAGCVINDMWDRDLDAQVERTRARPLASGVLGLKQAALFLFALLLCGLIVLLQFNWLTIMLGFCSLPLVIAYPFMKRITYWPQLFLGFTFNFGALMGWSAMSGALSYSAVLLYFGGILWTIGYDTIYAHQDKEDDVLIGVRSTALKFGEKSRVFVGGLYAGCALSFASALYLYSLSVVLFFISLAVMIFALFWQMMRWDMDDQQSSLKAFKSNRDFGLILVVLCFIGHYWPLIF